MGISERKIKKIKKEVKFYMVRNSFRASSNEIAKSLGYDLKLVGRLKNEIEKEMIEKIEKWTVEKEFSEIEKMNKKLTRILKKIIADPKISNTNRKEAVKILKEIHYLIPRLKNKVAKSTPKIYKTPKIYRTPK